VSRKLIDSPPRKVAYEPISLAVGLFPAAFSLRGIEMMRAMDEICRELVATLPPAVQMEKENP